MSFLDEIRRRNVHRVALAYLASAWLIVQVAETLAAAFGFTEALVRTVIILFAIGFIPAVILSWAFEWTPQGLTREVPATTAADSTRGFDRIIVLMLVLAVGFFAIDKFVIDPGRDAARIEQAERQAAASARVESYGDKSIIVLPFVNLSSDPEQEYFSAGMAEEVLNLLSRIRELRVISRSTAFSFKGKDIDIAEIARRTNVAHVLEGSVRKAGNQVRVSASLIDTATDAQVWTETYDRPLDDIFAIQNEISSHVVDELRLVLLDGPPTAEEINPDAYLMYLEARHIIHTSFEAESYEEAKNKLIRVVEMEPEFVPAIWELSRAYLRLWEQTDTVDQVETTKRKIRSLVDRMVALAPNSSYANGWLGYIAHFWENDLQKSAFYREKALSGAMDSNVIIQLLQAGILLDRLGRHREALAIYEYIVSRDPACTPCYLRLSSALHELGRHQEAAQRMESLLDWQTPAALHLEQIGVSWLVAGEPSKALDYFDRAIAAGASATGRLGALYDLGRVREFEEEFAAFRRANQDDPLAIATVYAWDGGNDAAFEWLEKYIDLQGAIAAGVVMNITFSRLRSDPRFQRFLDKHGYEVPNLSHIEFNPKLPAAVIAAIEADSANQ
jgi:TolB-like protein